MAKQVMRITLKAYEHELVDASATHKYKDSREQFEQSTHKRLIDISSPTQGTIESLQRLEMPAGVFIDLKMLQR